MSAASPDFFPLTAHPADAVIAYGAAGAITVRQFHGDVAATADALPAHQHVLNACQDRYRFMVGLGAALLRGKVTLMPSSMDAATLAQLRQDPGDLLLLHDGAASLPQDMPGFDLRPALTDAAPREALPAIAAEQVACVVFTSGSTGRPTPNRKRWGRLCLNGRSEGDRLRSDGVAIVATVPAQHMYGFESSVLLALHGGAAIWHGKPFYPADIAAALAAVPAPRMLVSTPFHLSTALDAGLSWPACSALLSATAPLATTLAARAEAGLGAPLYEIYGCTESGQVASRRTLDGPAWSLLPGVQMHVEGGAAEVFGGHVETPTRLSDVIERDADGRFRLLGRHADMVNIAGKRSSIAHLNQLLTHVPGVVDGCFFLPDAPEGDAAHAGVQRLCAFVVAPQLDDRALLQALRPQMDAVFLPRPIWRVERLPRNEASKLPRQALQALHERLAATRKAAP